MSVFYTEQPQTGDLSCEGCVFNRLEVKKKCVKDPHNSKRTVIVDASTDRFGCHSPKGEPYESCMERKVIFK